ncbi:MAG: hypothetical protein VB110_05865, partial [Bacteroidales bacterium]|nr:hypothetical protein [Bacteroidales bacterium]
RLTKNAGVEWTQTWTSGDGGYAAARKGAVLFTCTNGSDVRFLADYKCHIFDTSPQFFNLIHFLFLPCL